MGNFFITLREEFEENRILRIGAMTVLVYVLMKYALPLLYPFLFGALLVTWLRPFLRKFGRKNKSGRSLLTTGALIVIGCIPWILVFILYRAGMNCISMGMDHAEELKEQCIIILHTCSCYLEELSGMDSGEIEIRILQTVEGVGEQISDEAIPAALTISGDVVRKIGSFCVVWAVFFIFSILLAKDYEDILNWLKKQSVYHRLAELYDKTVRMLISYIKAQLIIMSVIGGICSVVFWWIGYALPFFWGYLVGFLDMLPFIGTGITLIPLAVFELILGNTGRAVILLLLYVVCYFVRQFMEPRLIGQRIGIHPLIILISIFLGVKLYGLAGILTGPLSFLLIRELSKTRQQTRQ